MYEAPNDLGLGRRYSPDPRDEQYLISQMAPPEVPDRYYRYWWPSGNWGDQGSTPQCVGYSWAHWLEDGPVTHAPRRPGSGFGVNPTSIYNKAQRVDAWPGENYAGTSVRAGAKVLQELGFIESYHWTWDVDTLINTILTRGPVVVGTLWYRDMFYPDDEGIISIGGAQAGGHAYVINGANADKGLFRIKNSWGRNWGKRGFAYISFEDMRTLISRNGEVCLAVERELTSGD